MADSYGAASAKGQRLVSRARLADPAEHYPYRHGEVSALIEANPPAGPAGPDDDRVRVRDLISPAIADASRDYIDSQAAYLEAPGEDTKAAYEVARDVLVAARQRHRAARPAGPTVTAVRGAE
jgi:hypothetical protein